MSKTALTRQQFFEVYRSLFGLDQVELHYFRIIFHWLRKQQANFRRMVFLFSSHSHSFCFPWKPKYVNPKTRPPLINVHTYVRHFFQAVSKITPNYLLFLLKLFLSIKMEQLRRAHIQKFSPLITINNYLI